MRERSWRKVLLFGVVVPAAVGLSPWLLRRASPATRGLLERSTGRFGRPEPSTPATLAGDLWGEEEANSQSPGAQRVRSAARDLFPRKAPGHGGEWRFTAAQVAKLKDHLEEK